MDVFFLFVMDVFFCDRCFTVRPCRQWCYISQDDVNIFHEISVLVRGYDLIKRKL